jgi:hypothetical protein
MKTFIYYACLSLISMIFFSGCKKDEDPLLMVSDFSVYMDEHPSAGKVIGNVIAGSSEGDLEFTLKSSLPAGSLTVNNETGVLSVYDAGLFDYEVNPEITGVVTVKCNGVKKDCNITIYLNDIEIIAGNDDIEGYFSQSVPISVMIGTRYSLTTPGTLMSLNLIGRNTGAGVQMGIYEDNSGIPGDLITTTSIGQVNNWGVISLPTDPLELEAGNYWIFANFSATGLHIWAATAPGKVMYFKNLTFGNPFPSNGSSFTIDHNYDFAFYMVVD